MPSLLRAARRSRGLILCAAVLSLASQTVRLKAQTTPDQAAYSAARAQTDPQTRILALQQYLLRFPAGERASAAHQALLMTYLSFFPQQTAAIHLLAAAQVASAPPGFDRWLEEARLAGLLASAEDTGADLQDARLWAEDALAALTEETYKHAMTLAQVRYKLPKAPREQLHSQFLEYRASFLATLANVDLREGKLNHAATLLAEASRIQPLSGPINALQGQLAFAQQHLAAALRSFERADALGSLNPRWREREVQLFAEQHHEDEAALDRDIDDVYRALFPPLFALPRRTLPPGGHTALLELFTGSGCDPCAGPDLAIDSLLGSFGRRDLIILAYDQHVPRPDPLANPDTIARAATYGLNNTPAAFLDGEPVQVLGASRRDVENIVISFADEIEAQASLPSGLQLSVTVSASPPDSITALASLALAPKLSPNTENTGDVSFRKLAQAVLFVALVQDNVRYSGENGIRFHRMVVRSLAQSPASTFLGIRASTPAATFHLTLIQQAQTAYLTDYEHTNERFGPFQFATKNIPLQPGDLAVVAWVQDPSTHRILQASFAPVPPR